ncbi:MAG: SulP family inorganic anion transporter [Acidobacteria bacterium]|nr:SulP family inorganic anion transporter [Acidobacteriota bacterium]
MMQENSIFTSQIQRLFLNFSQLRNQENFWERLRGDFFGGTVAALIAVPYGMALSVAMGMRPEAGLYTSIIGGIVAGFLSSSPVLISGLSATAAPILGAVTKTHGIGAALITGLLCGLAMTLIGALKLGRFANYLPQSIVTAFMSGLGLTIFVSQLKAFFGVQPQAIKYNFGVVDDLIGVLLVLPSVRAESLLIGGVVILAMILLPKWNENIPASIIGVFVATVVAKLAGFDIARVGELPSGFPLPHLIHFDLNVLPSLLHPAVTLAGLFTINQALTALAVNRSNNIFNREKCDRELIAQGTANLLTPFFGAPPGVAMLARTIASTRAGAMSRLSVISHSFVLILFILPLRGMIAQIPLSALAAVTVMVGWQLTNWSRFVALRRMPRVDAALFLLTFSIVVMADLITGVGLGFLIAMILFVERAAESTRLEPVAVTLPYYTTTTESGVHAFRLVGPLFFATSERILLQLRAMPPIEVLVLDVTATGTSDTSAIELFRGAFEMQRSRGGDLFLTGIDPHLYQMLEDIGLIAEIGVERFTLKTDATKESERFYALFGSLLRSQNG